MGMGVMTSLPRKSCLLSSPSCPTLSLTKHSMPPSSASQLDERTDHHQTKSKSEKACTRDAGMYACKNRRFTGITD